MATQDEMDNLLLSLEKQNKELTQLGKTNMEVPPGFFMFDIYILGLLNRSVNLNKGFISLIRDKNFITAAPIVRIHLDSLLRLYAPLIIDFNIDDFALQVYKGTPIRKIKDKANRYLTDSYLVGELSKLPNFDWVKNVYETGNAFVHFSDQTIFACMKIIDKTDRRVSFTIGQHDEFIPLDEKHGAAFWMTEINKGIMILVQSWIDHKKKNKN